MTSLQETCDAILQYLESGPQADDWLEHSEEGLLAVPGPPEEPLVLASIRCLGRYAPTIAMITVASSVSDMEREEQTKCPLGSTGLYKTSPIAPCYSSPLGSLLVWLSLVCRHCPLHFTPLAYARTKPEALILLCRFLAEVPDAFSERVQKLLPFLMTAEGGEGIPFLLPALSQVLDPNSPDIEGQAGWVTALLQQQVRARPSSGVTACSDDGAGVLNRCKATLPADWHAVSAASGCSWLDCE